MKGGRSIAEAEGHNSVLVGAVARVEGSEVFNVFLESDTVKGMANIKLGEDAGLGQACERFFNQRYQVLVFLRDGVQLVIINAESLSTSRLLGKQYR